MTSSSRVIVAMLVVALLGAAFWVLALSPKREEASKLGNEVSQLQSSLVLAQNQVSEGLAAQREFPSDYRQLVVLGKAVPASDDSSSLLVELNRIAERSGVTFESILLSTEGASAEASATGGSTTAPEASATSAVPASATIPPTEAAAALLPLGATIGPAGLAVMPYTLSFQGNFFHVADFIGGLDSLVKATNAKVSVDGRLITLDGFALTESTGLGFPDLDASFTVTTYLVSPGQGITAGATPGAPAPVEATPASTTTSSAR
jgi:Tfp pilus assembly protein PilO